MSANQKNETVGYGQGPHDAAVYSGQQLEETGWWFIVAGVIAVLLGAFMVKRGRAIKNAARRFLKR